MLTIIAVVVVVAIAATVVIAAAAAAVTTQYLRWRRSFDHYIITRVMMLMGREATKQPGEGPPAWATSPACSRLTAGARTGRPAAAGRRPLPRNARAL